MIGILLTSYVAWAAVQAAEPGGDLTVTPDNDQTGAEPETERESNAGRATGGQKFVHLDRTEVETSLADVDQAM